MSTGKTRSPRGTPKKTSAKVPKLLQPNDDGRVDWLSAVDQIKQLLGLVEDKDIANKLDVPVSTFSEFRNETGNLPWMAKLRILQLLGYEQLSDAIDLLTQEETTEKARRKTLRQARKSSRQPLKVGD